MESGGQCSAESIRTGQVHGDAVTDGNHGVYVLRGNVVHRQERDKAILVIQLKIVTGVQGLVRAAVVRTHDTLGGTLLSRNERRYGSAGSVD